MAKEKTSKAATNKTQYVLGLRGDLPAKEVVKQAKVAGISLTEKYVYRIRSGAKAKVGTTPRPSSKADFILGLAPSTPARDVVARAEKRGIQMSETYVYMVRAKQKRGGASGAARGHDVAPAFRKLVLDLGFSQAKSLLADLERRVGVLFQGRPVMGAGMTAARRLR